MAVGNYVAAVRYFETAIRANADFAEAHFSLFRRFPAAFPMQSRSTKPHSNCDRMKDWFEWFMPSWECCSRI
jgi:hypothetical protein